MARAMSGSDSARLAEKKLFDKWGFVASIALILGPRRSLVTGRSRADARLRGSPGV
jgi:hypothetical protein